MVVEDEGVVAVVLRLEVVETEVVPVVEPVVELDRLAVDEEDPVVDAVEELLERLAVVEAEVVGDVVE